MERIIFPLLAKQQPKLSNLVINSSGKLVCTKLPLSKIFHQMVKDCPFICWWMLIGMILIFFQSVWAVANTSITVTHRAEILIYFFLVFVSFSVVVGLVVISFYWAKLKLKNNQLNAYETNYKCGAETP